MDVSGLRRAHHRAGRHFVLIARALGPHEYGAFVGATALIAIVGPFAGVGGGNLLVKNVSRDKSLFTVYWGNALLLLALSGIVLLGLVVVVAHLILPPAIPLLLVVLICLSDLVGARIQTSPRRPSRRWTS